MARRWPTAITAAVAVVGTAVGTDRGQDRPLLLDPGTPVTASTPVRPVAYDDDPPPRKPAARFAPMADRKLSAADVERPRTTAAKDDRSDAFLDRWSDLSDRDRKRTTDRDRDDDRRPRTSRFGEYFGTLFGRENKQGWFCSDHEFPQFASPVTNPFLFTDPRAVTELRPVFIYQKVPNPQPNFQGGDLFFFGGRGSLAITDRLSVTVNKIGGIGVYPGSKSLLDSQVGLAELWLGPKITWYRDPEAGTVLATGSVYQLSIGSAKAFQDTGSMSVTPYVSAAQTLLRSRYGSLNGIASVGYAFGLNRERSDYLYASGHLDFDIGDAHRFHPLVELNWFQYTTSGTARPFAGEGRDLINFGGQAKGSNLLSGAIGGRFKLSENWQMGAAYEVPLVGNKDLFRYRFTVDAIFRY